MLHLDLVFIVVTPMLLEFFFLRSGKRNAAASAVIAALICGALFAFLAFGPMWTVSRGDFESPTPRQQVVGFSIVALLSVVGFSIIAFIPAAIFGVLFRRFRGFKK